MAWRSTTIGDVLTLQRGFDITRATQSIGDVPVISSGGIASWHSESMSDGPGVVIGRKGTLGKVFYWPGPYWPHDTTLWVRDFKGSNARFVYYFFRNLDVTFLDVGSANPTLNRNHVHPIRVAWPDVSTQGAIAEVLGALDDKIVANGKAAVAADRLAMAEYQRVVFDATSEVPLAQFTTTQYGVTLNPVLGGSHRLARVTDINKRPWVEWDGAPSCDPSDEDVRKYGLCEGDVLVARMADPGKVGIVDASAPPSVFASYLVRVRPTQGFEPLFLYYFFRSPAYVGYTLSAAQGSVQRNMNARVIVATAVPKVSAQRQRAFSEVAGTLRRRIAVAVKESRCLTDLRDTLLPHLLSGRITIREAEERVEESL